MIRHEEALSLTIKAAPPSPADRAPNLAAPDRGQIYFKVPLSLEGTEDALLRRRRLLRLDLSADRVGFFDHWLSERYREERFRRRPQDRDASATEAEDSSAHVMMGFPVLYHARRGELFTLLRFPLERLDVLDGLGEPFVPPKRREREAGVLPPPPVALSLTLPELDTETPYAVDENALSRLLAVQEEQVGVFGRWLRDVPARTPESVVNALAALLAVQPDTALEPAFFDQAPDLGADPVGRLAQVVIDRGAEVRVFPMGLAWDGGAVYATHHLQRDIEELLREDGPELPREGPLSRYLLREPRPARLGTLVATHGPALTPEQRLVADRLLASPLTVAEGPPGTGKTALILALAAHAVVERMSELDDLDELPDGPLLFVTSTNNRAVDNVTGPLGLELPPERLPVALRVGSRIVLNTTTRDTLARTSAWLERAQVDRAAEERFAAAFSPLRALLRRLKKAGRDKDGRDRARRELADLRRQLDGHGEPPPEAPPPELLALVQGAARSAQTTLKKLAKGERRPTGEGSPRPAGSAEVYAHARQRLGALASGLEGAVEELAAARGLDLDLEVPAEDTDLVPYVELLGESLSELEEELADELGQAARHRDTLASLTRREEELARELEEASPVEELDSVRSDVERLSEGLYPLALAARESWAARHRDRLGQACRAAMREFDTRGTLRLLAERGGVWKDLLRLFPVWGCTLLSVPSVFPARPGSLGRVVIDEAGQCHPANAITVLLRAENALIIGDTNQLEPVIEVDSREEQRVVRRARGRVDLEALEPYRAVSNTLLSAQALAVQAVSDVPRLRDHFRCQPEIIEVSNRLCGYELRVHTPRRSLGTIAPRLREPVLGIDVASGNQEPWYGSWRNPAEVRAAVGLVAECVRLGVDPGQVAVLTPYRGQLRALRDALKAEGLPLDDGENESAALQVDLFAGTRGALTTGTVHRFQGGERDVVVFSSVVTEPRSLPFLNQRHNLVNVAVSRARLHFVVIGSANVLRLGGVTRELVNAVGGWLR